MKLKTSRVASRNVIPVEVIFHVPKHLVLVASVFLVLLFFPEKVLLCGDPP